MIGLRAFVPIIHAALPDRPDERDTIETAATVAAALHRLDHDTEVVYIGTDFAPLHRLAKARPAVVFNLVEAVDGESAGAHLPVRQLERLGLPHTGASASALTVTASKIGTKRLLGERGIRTPTWWRNAERVPAGARVIVKSDTEHGSLGIDAGSVVPGHRAAAEIGRREARHGGRFFAECFVEGREFNVALIERDGRPRVLPIPEILFDALSPERPRIVDYEAKWLADSDAYRQTPRRFGLEREDPDLDAELGRIAIACWHAAGLGGYARVDFRVDHAGRPFVLEINPNPALAPDAGFAATAAEAGLGYDALIAAILAATGVRHAAVA